MAAQKVCSLDELEVNHAKRVVVDGEPIALVRDASDQVHAIGDVCSHGEISLSEGFVEGDTLECWAHGSQFSLTTGKPLNLPAYEPVPVYEVEIRGGDVLIDPASKKKA